MRRAVALLAATAAAAATATGCGGSAASEEDGRPSLTVSAASSLKPAFERYGRDFRDATARFSFAGSDELATQIRRGVRPDVYAAANTRLPDALHAEGRVERPVVFAVNRLVLARPAGSREVGSLHDLARPGVTVAMGAASVPVGAYTRELLARLGRRERDAILANVRSNEPDVASVVGKLSQGAVDAGFVYASDVVAAGGELEAIELPRELRPAVAYAAAVVDGARHPAEARAFVRGLVSGPGAEALRTAGFGPPPP